MRTPRFTGTSRDAVAAMASLHEACRVESTRLDERDVRFPTVPHGDELETLRKKLRLEDATAEGVFKDAVKGVLQAPYTAASSALKLRTRPGALASLERLMDVRRGVDIVVANAKFLESSGGAEAFAETLAGGGKSTVVVVQACVCGEVRRTVKRRRNYPTWPLLSR